MHRYARYRSTLNGFTLIELLVVLAIVALLLTIAAPRYVDRVEHAKEATLISSLKTMRDAIDKFEADHGKLPATLAELVERRYLKEVPRDPITERNDSWIETSALEAGVQSEAPVPGIADVKSGADGDGRNGKPYKEW